MCIVFLSARNDLNHRPTLKCHIATHSKENTYASSCPKCHKGLAFASALCIHLKIHSGEPFECKLYVKKFRQKVHLESHVVRVLEGSEMMIKMYHNPTPVKYVTKMSPLKVLTSWNSGIKPYKRYLT